MILDKVYDSAKQTKEYFYLICYTQSWLTKSNVFLIFDYVHLLKNIRNNWSMEKTQKLECVEDHDQKIAPWKIFPQQIPPGLGLGFWLGFG